MTRPTPLAQLHNQDKLGISTFSVWVDHDGVSARERHACARALQEWRYRLLQRGAFPHLTTYHACIRRHTEVV